MTNIGWTNKTWNPLVGCSRVSEGCRNCYAERMAGRLAAMADRDASCGLNPGRKAHYANVVMRKDGVPLPRWNNTVALIPEALDEPMRWRKPAMVFVNSMSDLFHPQVPFEFIDRVFAVMALCRQHTFQVLTKRPEQMLAYMAWVGRQSPDSPSATTKKRVAWWCRDIYGRYPHSQTESSVIRWPLPNVWLGTSCEDQATADERVPHLLGCPAALRFLSLEPLLGPIDLQDVLGRWFCTYCPAHYAEYVNGCPRCHLGEAGTGSTVRLSRIGWVIIGVESRGGSVARLGIGEYAEATEADWLGYAEQIVEECDAAGVPVFVKQIPHRGRVLKEIDDRWPEALRRQEMPGVEGGAA